MVGPPAAGRTGPSGAARAGARYGLTNRNASLGGGDHSPARSSRRIARAIAWARGTRLATSRYSSGLCALPPTGPTAQMVGAPTAAVKPLSAQPPLNSPVMARPLSPAAALYISNSFAAAGLWVSGRDSPRMVSFALVPGT